MVRVRTIVPALSRLARPIFTPRSRHTSSESHGHLNRGGAWLYGARHVRYASNLAKIRDSVSDFELTPVRHAQTCQPTTQKTTATSRKKRLLYTRTDVIDCYLDRQRLSLGQGFSDANIDMFNNDGISKDTLAVLKRYQHSVADLKLWAWVLAAKDGEEMTQRYLSCSHQPLFLLLLILRQPWIRADTLSLIIRNALQKIKTPYPNARSDQEVMSEDNRAWSLSYMEERQFCLLTVRLHRHARQVWPPAVITIARMVVAYISNLMSLHTRHKAQLGPRSTYARIGAFYRRIIQRLSLPAIANPFENVSYSWAAQRYLLDEAQRIFHPPLHLDRKTYRAIAKVLAASRKTAAETKLVRLQSRSLPPWRIDADGMDSLRSPEDDLTRTVLVLDASKRAGYSERGFENALRIIGGRESDGTPTTPTRHFLSHYRSKSDIWQARIITARTAQEAWITFRQSPSKPSQSMFLAMFRKIVSERIRVGRQAPVEFRPGDMREVGAPADENFTSSERERLRPPTFQELYWHMMHVEKVQPQSNLLAYLIQNASSLATATEYMQHSALRRDAVSGLVSSLFKHRITLQQSLLRVAALESIPRNVLHAFISLLCRLHHLDTKIHSDSTNKPPLPSKLLAAVTLLRDSQSTHLPSWYVIFAQLARYDTVFVDGHEIYDIVRRWDVLQAVLRSFFRCGNKLDAHGFFLVCKVAEGSLAASNDGELVISGVLFLKQEFRKLLEEEPNGRTHQSSPAAAATLPALVHSIHGVHIFRYISILALVNDSDELMYVLKWMMQNRETLNSTAIDSAYRTRGMLCALNALRVFAHRNTLQDLGKGRDEFIKQLEDWICGLGGVVDEGPDEMDDQSV